MTDHQDQPPMREAVAKAVREAIHRTRNLSLYSADVRQTHAVTIERDAVDEILGAVALIPSPPSRETRERIEAEIASKLDAAIGGIQRLTGYGEDAVWRPANKAWEAMVAARDFLADDARTPPPADRPSPLSEGDDPDGPGFDIYDPDAQRVMSWTMNVVGDMLGAETWEGGDGSESVEGDLQAEVIHIMRAAGLVNADGDILTRADVAALLALPAPPATEADDEGDDTPTPAMLEAVEMHQRLTDWPKSDQPKQNVRDLVSASEAGPGVEGMRDRHDHQLGEVIDERDAAEESLSQAYYLVTGRSPEWSNLFGHTEALSEIEEAVSTLKAAARAALAAPSSLSAGTFQQRVLPWMMACFGPEILRDGRERNHRFLEESLELVQALGCTASEAHQLVDYTFSRPVGEPSQEVGGVMVCIAALCLAHGLDMDRAAEIELARIWTKVEAIRAKHAMKPMHLPLPGTAPPSPQPETKGGVR